MSPFINEAGEGRVVEGLYYSFNKKAVRVENYTDAVTLTAIMASL